jgi:adenylate cyclase
VPLDLRTRIAIRLIPKITALSAFAGAVYGYFATAAQARGVQLLGTERGLLAGTIISIMLTALNIFVLQGPTRGGVRRAPFLLHLTLKSLIYAVVFVFGVTVSAWLVPIGPFTGVQVGLTDAAFFIGLSLVVNFVLDMNSLLGQNVLLNFVTGRYFRPHVEERVVLFVDMKNSTAAAERLGEVNFHRLVSRFVADLTVAIVGQRGEIHKYIGDEIIVTWPLKLGLKDAHCVRACVGVIEQLEKLGPSYQSEFGLTVECRAGLHSGPVVVGEMGTIKKEIALIGDTLNTAARLVDYCRDSGESAIISAALLNQLAVPAGIAARAIGMVQLRGKKQPIELFALR